MSHINSYGIVEQGTREDCVVLWGPKSVVLQVDFSEDVERPIVTLVRDDGMTHTLSVDFKDAAEIDQEDCEINGHAASGNGHAGWECEIQEYPYFAIRISSARRKQTMIIQSDAEGLLFKLDNKEQRYALVMGISTESLISMNLWPAMPLAGVTYGCQNENENAA